MLVSPINELLDENLTMGSRLLVADSDPVLTDIYRRYFSSRGYTVDTAMDAIECIEKLPDADLLIVELELPLGGGDSVVERLRDDPLLREIPVILIASENSREWLAALTVSPVVQCLQKPFRLAALLDGVRTVGAL